MSIYVELKFLGLFFVCFKAQAGGQEVKRNRWGKEGKKRERQNGSNEKKKECSNRTSDDSIDTCILNVMERLEVIALDDEVAGVLPT